MLTEWLVETCSHCEWLLPSMKADLCGTILAGTTSPEDTGPKEKLPADTRSGRAPTDTGRPAGSTAQPDTAAPSSSKMHSVGLGQ